MPRCRFVDPTRVVRLSLSGDDWIEIRRELTAGQYRDMLGHMSRVRTAGADPEVDPTLHSRARALAYLVAWSFVDASGNIAPISEGALDFLEIESLNEIRDAILEHELATSQEKKRLSGAPASEAILLSVG